MAADEPPRDARVRIDPVQLAIGAASLAGAALLIVEATHAGRPDILLAGMIGELLLSVGAMLRCGLGGR